MSDTTAGPSSQATVLESSLLYSKPQASILDRASNSASFHIPKLSLHQSQVDGMVGGFVAQAADWNTLAAILAGGGACRLGRVGIASFGNTPALQAFSILGGLGSEVAAFEITHRSLTSLSPSAEGKNLWQWSGSQGLKNGLLSSFVTFGTLKSTGRLAGGENFILQHFLQDSAMVTGHQLSALAGFSPKPTQPLAEQFLSAEITNLQLGAGMTLAHPLSAGLHGLERGLDLAFPPPKFPSLLEGGALQGGWKPALAISANLPVPEAEPPSSLPANILAMVSKKGDDGGKVIPFRRPGKDPMPLSPDKKQSQTQQEGPVKLVALGDIHAKWPKVNAILKQEFPNGEGQVLSVGDLVNYPVLPKGIEFFFTHGNHENFNVVDVLHRNADPERSNYHPIFAGDLANIGGLTVAGLPGVFSQHYYLNPKDAPLDFWTPERVGAFGNLKNRVDILLMHEAPKDVGFTKDGEDLGNPLLTSLIEFLNPRMAFFGHHHQSFVGKLGETRIIGLDYPKRSYGVLEYDAEKDEIRWKIVEAELTPNPKRVTLLSFNFPWEAQGKKDKVFPIEVIPMERDKRMEAVLKEKHVENVKSELTTVILEEIKDSKIEDKPFTARLRASTSVNTVLPFVARYAAALEANPKMPLEKRQELIGKAYDDMTQGLMPQASPDLVRAFEGLLKALGIVKA